MRLLIDAQCVQSTSSLRGIGRYALSLTRALVQEAGDHHVEVLLNAGDDPARLLRARTALESFLSPGSVHVFDAAWAWTPPYDHARRPAAEAAYAAAVRSLDPDVLLVLSPFEGDAENVTAICSGPDDPPSAAVLYDLIPALDPGTYLLGPGADIYWRRFEQFARCDALLAISEHSGRQAQQLLGETCPAVTPVWGGPYPSGDFPAFEQQSDDAPVDVPQRFLLGVGGDHPRKNLDRLVQAWARVPAALRAGTPLVLTCRLNPGTVRRLRRLARRGGLARAELVLTGGVSETTLRQLYDRALAFVFPSTEEGLGMPPLEAMAQGCPTVLASGSSLSELAEDPTCFFDGLDVDDIARSLIRLLSDDGYRDRLRGEAARSAERFTWARSAQLAWKALEAIPLRERPAAAAPPPLPAPLSDADAIAGLAGQPRPVRLDAPLPDGPPGPLGLPLAARAALTPATALLAPDCGAASAAVRAGLLEAPVLLCEDALVGVARHDNLAALARALRDLPGLPAELAAQVVDAALRPPRWTLERPRPVWLLLDESVGDDVVAACGASGVDLVRTGPAGAALAPSVDVVLVAAEHLIEVLAPLADARRRGAVVVVLHRGAVDPTAPDWTEVVVVGGSLADAGTWQRDVLPLAARWGRTTGWPWRDRGRD